MAKSTSRSIYIDQSSAENALVKLTATMQKLEAEIAKGNKAGKEMTASMAKLGETKAQVDEVKNAIDKGLKPTFVQTQQQVNKLRNELKRMSEDAPGYAAKFDAYKKAKANFDDMKKSLSGVAEAQKQMSAGSSGLTKFSLASGVAIGNLYTKAAEIAVDTVKRFVTVNAEFEKSVANLSAITGATGKDLEFLKNTAIDLSATTTRSAVDYVEAMKLIASAKPELLSNKEALVEVTKAASLLADASGLELPDASKRLTDALNQFGAPASQAAKYVDALAAAAKYGAAEVPEVTDALLKFGTLAKSANISIYESAGLIELLAEKGVKGAEAGTQLRNVLLRLNAVGALDKKALDALEKAGVNTQILGDKSLSLEVRLRELGKIQNDTTKLVQVFNSENLNAAQIILQNTGRFAELAKQTKEVGVASQQATVNTDTLSAAWDRLGNARDAEFLNNGGAFTGFLKSIVNEATKALKVLGSVVTVGKALATLDFGFFGRVNKEIANKKETAATNTRVNTIIDVYTQQEQGKADATQRILKRLRENVDTDYKAFYDARAKGDKAAAAKAFADLQLAGKALAKFKADQLTIGTTPNEPATPGTTKAKAGTSTKQSGDTEFNTKLKESLAAARAEILKGFADKTNLEAVTYNQPIKPNLTVENPDKLLEDGMNLVDKILNEQAITNKRAGLQLDVLKFGLNSRKGLDAQKQLLDEQMQQELSVANLTENEIALIKEKYRQQEGELEANYVQSRISAISSYAQQAIGIFDQLSQAQTNRENAAFENEKKNNTKRRKNVEDLQKNRVITEIEAKKRLADIDAEEDKKKEELDKKQKERQKRMAIAQALINGALSVTKAASEYPFPFSLIPIAFAVATTAAQIAVISSQKFARGGKVLPNGKIRETPNIPTQPNGDNVLATVRTNEVILNEEQQNALGGAATFARIGVPGFAKGGRVTAPWLSRPYASIDYGSIVASQQVIRQYATGGLVTSGGATASATQPTAALDPVFVNLLQQNAQAMQQMQQTNAALVRQLNAGISANVTLKQMDDTRAIENNAIAESRPL